jgi:hypothetical protein
MKTWSPDVGASRSVAGGIDVLVSLHSDFDWLGVRWLQGWQKGVVNKDGDTARHAWAA